MKTVIYLDELLLVNFLVAVFLLSGTGLLCGVNTPPRRIAAAAAVAATASLWLLVPQLPFPLQLLVKTVSAALCVLVGFGLRRLRRFLRLCAWYLVLNLMLAGIVSGLILTRSVSGLQTNNLVVYLDISPLVLLVCVLSVHVVLRILLWCFERPGHSQSDSLCIELGQQQLSVRAFCDTGFSLAPLGKARAGIMVSVADVKDQLPETLRAFLEEFLQPGTKKEIPTPCLQWKMQFVCCTTAMGTGVFPAILSNKVALTHKGNLYSGKALVMFCQQSFPYGCAAAYSPDFLDGIDNVQPQQRGSAECCSVE